MTGYAISNLSNKSYIMQHWTGTTLNIPSDITYYQPTKEFGTATLLENGNYFTATTTPNTHKDYVFENNNDNAATSMYFEYTVKLKDMTGADFEDGTFYRYNNVIYKSFADIYKAYNNVPGLFGGNSINPVNVVVSVEDGDKILLANEKAPLLSECAVVFVK